MMRMLTVPVMLILVVFSSSCAVLKELRSGADRFIPGSAAARSADALLPDEPLTTSLRDARFEEPALDAINPQDGDFAVLNAAEMNADGAFVLSPGFYRLDAVAFVLRPGFSFITEETTFIYAEPKGSRVELIQSVLRRSCRRPDIANRAVQSLIVEIALGRTYSDLSPELRYAAAELLSISERFELNGGLLSLADNGLINRLFGGVPSAVHNVVSRGKKLRGELRDHAETFTSAMEFANLLAGGEEVAGMLRFIPSGRWSRHLDGYFVRYYFLSPGRLRFELFVPLEMTYDEQGVLQNIGPLNRSDLRAARRPAVLFYPSRHIAVTSNPAAPMLVSSGMPIDR